jgi:hypothetical protein
MFAAGFSGFSQIQKHPWCAVNAMAGNKGRTDQTKKSGIFFSSIGKWLLQPVIVAASCNLENLAHGFDAVLLAMRLNTLVSPTNPSRAELGLHGGNSGRNSF